MSSSRIDELPFDDGPCNTGAIARAPDGTRYTLGSCDETGWIVATPGPDFNGSRWVVRTCSVLKLAAFAGLALCLVEPLLTEDRPQVVGGPCLHGDGGVGGDRAEERGGCPSVTDPSEEPRQVAEREAEAVVGHVVGSFQSPATGLPPPAGGRST